MTVQDFRDLVRYVMANPFLTDVAVAGPFEPSATPPVDDVLGPAAGRSVKWESPAVGPPGRIPLPASKKEAVAFVAAEVTVPAALRTRLQVGAAHPLRAWLNGKPVYTGRPGDKAVPDEDGADVELRPGTNRLVFQVTYNGDKEVLYARLLDPQRKLRYPEGQK
jgi:hypothetical protein